ncbi:hypothetical protein KKC59_00910, partial [bacterium]|nr:hypothetical protein [bacterium]
MKLFWKLIIILSITLSNPSISYSLNQNLAAPSLVNKKNFYTKPIESANKFNLTIQEYEQLLKTINLFFDNNKELLVDNRKDFLDSLLNPDILYINFIVSPNIFCRAENIFERNKIADFALATRNFTNQLPKNIRQKLFRTKLLY